MLTVLTALSLIGFTAATLTITDADGNPPLESRMVFAGLSAVYVLFYNFCKDMNDPFDGVYQIKRSSAASYLLQIKWLIANQPYGADIKFDTRGLAPVYDGNEVMEVGKGARNVETSSEVQQQQSKTMTNTKDEREPQPTEPEQKAVAATTSIETPVQTQGRLATLEEKMEELRRLKELHSTMKTLAPGVSITTESPDSKASEVKVTRTLTAKDFMPERKKSTPADSPV